MLGPFKPRGDSDKHFAVQQVELLNMSAIQGDAGDKTQPHFLTRKLLEKGCANEPYHIGSGSTKKAITEGGVVPSPWNKDPNSRDKAHKHLKPYQEAIYVVDVESVQVENLPALSNT